MTRSQHYQHGDDRHHPVPRSRGGKEWIWVNRQLHELYHCLFVNRTPQEVEEVLKAICILLEVNSEPVIRRISDYFWKGEEDE